MDLILAIIVGMFGAWSTYKLAQIPSMGVVRSSALLSLVVGLIFYFFPSGTQFDLIPVIFIGASFVGMTSVERISSGFQIALAGMVFGMIYHYMVPTHTGFGGALGTSACLGGIVVLGVRLVR